MSQPTGFVPPNWQFAGKLLLIIGILSLILIGISTLSGWLTLPLEILIFGLVTILIGLYLLFVVPKEEIDGAKERRIILNIGTSLISPYTDYRSPKCVCVR